MAVLRKKKTKKTGWLLFWLAFFTGVTFLFIMNMGRIKDTLKETNILSRLGREAASESVPPSVEQRIQDMALPVLTDNDASVTEAPRSEQPPSEAPQKEASRGDTAANVKKETKPEVTEKKTVERAVYLMKLDSAGTIVWAKVKRVLPASDSPLQDALASLIKGPSTEEKKQGLISLIPTNSKIQSATVRGNTAYISFNEDFLFNTYGTEGYASQRRQIVLTATEFNNVKDVQILIDGKRIDYLGEAVWIGSPVSRAML
jgi:spore germination protein GerM